MAMGTWKTRQILKKGRGKSERTKKARVYWVKPPITGWPGGRPEDNGFRARGMK